MPPISLGAVLLTSPFSPSTMKVVPVNYVRSISINVQELRRRGVIKVDLEKIFQRK